LKNPVQADLDLPGFRTLQFKRWNLVYEHDTLNSLD